MKPQGVIPRRAGSDSTAQRNAEKAALHHIAQALNLPGLEPLETQKRFKINAAFVVVDAFYQCENQIILIEVNARVGTAMKTSTRNKVLKDTLKMLLVERNNKVAWTGRRVRKILVFLDKIALDSFGPKTWAVQVWAEFGIETHVCPIPEAERAALIEAQRRQDLRMEG